MALDARLTETVMFVKFTNAAYSGHMDSYNGRGMMKYIILSIYRKISVYSIS